MTHTLNDKYHAVYTDSLTDAELGRKVRAALKGHDRVEVLGKPGHEKINAVMVRRQQ